MPQLWGGNFLNISDTYQDFRIVGVVFVRAIHCICIYIISGRGRKNGAHICIILGRGRKTTGAPVAPPCLVPLININMYTYNSYNHSLTGVTSFLFGDVRFLTLDQWVSEYRNFEKLRTIPFFHRFKKTKSFQTWKRVVKRQKFISASQKL